MIPLLLLLSCLSVLCPWGKVFSWLQRKTHYYVDTTSYSRRRAELSYSSFLRCDYMGEREKSSRGKSCKGSGSAVLHGDLTKEFRFSTSTTTSVKVILVLVLFFFLLSHPPTTPTLRCSPSYTGNYYTSVLLWPSPNRQRVSCPADNLKQQGY